MFERFFKGADKSHKEHEVAESQPASVPEVKKPQPLLNFDKPGTRRMTAESIKVRSSKSLEDIFADIINDQPKFGDHI